MMRTILETLLDGCFALGFGLTMVVMHISLFSIARTHLWQPSAFENERPPYPRIARRNRFASIDSECEE